MKRFSLATTYALAGACIVPVFGFLALSGTGHRADLYRYIAPLFVGTVCGFLLGRMRQRWLDKISELSSAHDQLHEQEEKYRQVYNAPGEPIIIFSPRDGSFIEANRALREVYGYAPEEISGLSIDMISEGSPPWNRVGAMPLINKALEKGSHSFEWLSRKKNGELFWAEISLKRTRFKNQNFLTATIRDIEARKQAEEELRNEKERLSVTLRSIGDGVITTDINGRIVFLNKKAEELTGWTNDEAVGADSNNVFNIINKKTGQQCMSPIHRVLEFGEVMSLDNHTALIAKDGTVRPIADSSAPIKNRKDKTVGTVLVFRDTTNEKLLEEELFKIKKLESIGVLAGGIAHDFNNILSSILGNIELAGHRTEKDPKTAYLLQSAQQATLRAAKLTDQLLTFAKGGDPVKEVLELPELIKSSADFILYDTSITCRHSFSEPLWHVNADSGQLSQVIQNILLNARHALPGDGEIVITCRNIDDASSEPFLNADTGEFVRITIQDNGIGIPKEHMDKIFDPYFTTKQEGSGLGLAICHSIINKHDGYLAVDSSPGQGTAFSIYLPAVHPPEQKKPCPDPGPLCRSARIMVMDDEEMLRSVLKSQLKALGHEAILVENGDQAIATYQEQQEKCQPIDAVIMDLTIPGGMGGQEAARKLLQIDPKAKLIVASGYSNDPVMANFRNYGFQAAVTKPFDLKELDCAIATLLQ